MVQGFAANGWTSISNLVRAGFARLSSISRARMWRRHPRRLCLCETLSLGNRGFLAVVRYEEQQFLVGGTNSSIAMLAQLPPSSRLTEELTEEEFEVT